MKVFYSTNRRPTNDDEIFGEEPGAHVDLFRVGWCECAQIDPGGFAPLPAESRDPTILGPVTICDDAEENDPATTRTIFTRRGSKELFAELLKELRPQNGVRTDALIYIPGFNHSFIDSIQRAALLAQLYASPSLRLAPLVFSWPSNGKMTLGDYRSDRRDAEISGGAMARTYAALARQLQGGRYELMAGGKDACGARVHLLAHSMGVYALRHGVAKIVDPANNIPIVQIFDTAILAAGDEHRDTLSVPHKLGRLNLLAERIEVYFNPKDKPVRIGDDFSDQFDRIGAYGPEDDDAARRIGVPVNIIDCSAADALFTDPTRHQYYRVSRQVVEDIRAVLRGDATPLRKKSEDRPGTWAL